MKNFILNINLIGYCLFLIPALINAQEFKINREREASLAEFEIKGSIRDKNNSDAYSGAEVYVLGGNRTTTDANGDFRIKVRLGDELILSSEEFETVYHIINGRERIDVKVKDHSESTSKVRDFYSSLKRRDRTSAHARLIDSAVFYKNVFIDKSLHFIEESLKVLGKSGHNSERALSFAVLGDIYRYYQQYDLAVSNYRISLKEKFSIKVGIQLGKALALGKQHKESLEYFEELSKRAKLNFDQKLTIFVGKGDAHLQLKQYEQAKNNYEKGLKLANETGNNAKITDLNSKLAEINAETDNIGQAITFYGNSLERAKKEGRLRSLQEKEKVADFYNEQNLYEEEIGVRKSALEDAEALYDDKNYGFLRKDETLAYDSIVSKQKINYRIAKALLAQEKLPEAITYLEESVNEANKRNDLVVAKDATRRLFEVYNRTGEYDKALDNYKTYVAIVDSLYVSKEIGRAHV